MDSIYLTKKNEGKEIWLHFSGELGNAAMICLNNLANEQKGTITKRAMLEAIAIELSKGRP